MILIENTFFNGKNTDVLIEGSQIQKIGKDLPYKKGEYSRIIDGTGTAILPSLTNGHTHSPMVLLRGSGDDMLLDQWLRECIWPIEAKFSDTDYYWGYRLAFLEMIKSGTGFFNEMYMKPHIALKALNELPLKGLINYPIIDGMNEEAGRVMAEDCKKFFKETVPPEGVQLGVAVHSVYANSLFSLEWVRDFAAEMNLKIHIHLSETEDEVKNSKDAHNGMSPVEYLESINFLSNRVLAAHTVWISERDMEILSSRGVTVIYNPVSNMKLATGKAFPFEELQKRGVPMLLGTDGAASNNNLDLFEEMKIGALLQKHHYRNPTLMNADKIFYMATKAGAETFSTGGGEIREGAEADLILVDIERPEMVPMSNLTSNIVYSTSGSSVTTLLCGGKILMENRIVEGESNILKNAALCAERLAGE